MKKGPGIILTVTLVYLFFFDWRQDVHWPPWAFLSATMALAIAWRLVKSNKLPLIIIITFAYILLNGIAFVEWRPLTEAMADADKSAVRLLAAHAMLEFLLLCGLFYTQWHRIRRPVAWGLLIGGLFHAFFLLIDQIAPRYINIPTELLPAFETKGLLGNRSIGASFAVIWIFFAIHFMYSNRRPDGSASYNLTRKRMWLTALVLGLGVPAILITPSSISYGAFTAAGLAWALALFYQVAGPIKFKNSWVLGLIALPFLVMGAAGALVVGPKYTDIHGMLRLQAWPMFWDCFYNGCIDTRVTPNPTIFAPNPWFGWGAGTFKLYGPAIQSVKYYMEGKWWLWAHNDWLQLALEYGFIGAGLSALSAGYLLWRSRTRPLLFASVSAYCVVMIGNYPMHIALTSLLGFWIAFEVMWGRRSPLHA